MKAQVFYITRRTCSFSGCTWVRHNFYDVRRSERGSKLISLCAPDFEKATGLKFIGTKWFKLVQVRG